MTDAWDEEMMYEESIESETNAAMKPKEKRKCKIIWGERNHGGRFLEFLRKELEDVVFGLIVD